MTVGRDRRDRWRRRAAAVARPAGQVALVAAWAVLSVATVLTGYSLAPQVAGWRPSVVTSASMVPALRPGDVVLVAPQTRRAPVLGAIVLFNRPGANGQVAHRVVAIQPDGRVMTKGDANPLPDSDLLPPGSIRGQVRLVVPQVGALRLITTPYWRDGVAWLVLLVASVLVALTVRPPDSAPSPGAQPVPSAQPPPGGRIKHAGRRGRRTGW